jgi:hypothetical protein
MKANVSVKLAMPFTSINRIRKAFFERAASTTLVSRRSRFIGTPMQI